MSQAYWILRSHLFRADEYICSECGAGSPQPYRECPDCGARMKDTDCEPAWVDEAEGLSALLDDDW